MPRVFINGEALDLEGPSLVGGQIKALAGAGVEDDVFEVQSYHAVPIEDRERVHLRDHQWFRVVKSGTATWRCLVSAILDDEVRQRLTSGS